MKRERINLIIKTTSNCNFSCTYCYDAVEKGNLKNQFITLDIVEKIAKVAARGYKKIMWTWHGGEPLLLGSEFYKSAHEIIFKYFKKEDVEITMQSNGSLYKANEGWIKELGIKISFSYDFTNENENRGYIEDNNFIKNSINVVGYEESKKILKTYKRLVSLGKTTSFNKIFLENYSEEQLNEMADNYYELFEYILYDKEENSFLEREIQSVLSMILEKNERMCSSKNCLGNFLSVNADGVIYQCDRFNSVNASRYNLGNIGDIEYTLLEVFEHETFKRIEVEQELFKKNCNGCEINSFCEGFCKANRLSDGKIDISKRDDQECIFRKRLFLKMFNKLFNIKKEEYLLLNEKIYDMLFENKFTPKFLLEEINEQNS